MKRASGVLMPIFSLPSPYGIGTMGKSAYKFIDFLRAAGQAYWQILPLVPSGAGNSPYSSYSSYAGNPYMIDLDLLIKEGLLKASEVRSIEWGSSRSVVDYSILSLHRIDLLRNAYLRGFKIYSKEMSSFRNENHWVENYALFMALKSHFGDIPWTQWPQDIRSRQPEALASYCELLKEDIDFHIFVQMLFYRQWFELRQYAAEKGIRFIGDLPIYVALDSADVWSEPQFFQLDQNFVPKAVAGVPPDNFSAEGQLWGNPLYDWDNMLADGYGWWIRRLDGARKLYDIIRIDHFRGLESYWAVPYGEKSALNGYWVKGPGLDFLNRMKGWFGNLELIAEDLGFLTPEVLAMRDGSGFPGMKILEFAFDPESPSAYLPHFCIENSVCYIGTHDNETIKGWVKSTPAAVRKYAAKYAHISDEEGWNWGLIRTGMSTCSNTFIVQMQDILELGPECRTNTPGIPDGNWTWRMLPDSDLKAAAKKLKEYTKLYGRLV